MSYVPQTQIWPDDPYIPGSLQCDVLTRQGLNCGNVIGQGRCYEYCQRLATHWEGKLLPLAIKMASRAIPWWVIPTIALADVLFGILCAYRLKPYN